MDQVVDVAILEALMHSPPPALVRPFFSEEDLDLSDLARSERRQEEAEVHFGEWRNAAVAKRERLGTFLRSNRDLVEGHHLRLLLHAAEVIERECAELATEASRSEKLLRRLAQRLARVSPRAGDRFEKVAERALDLAEKEIEARLDAALHFRALRAELMPNNRASEAIGEPREFQRALDAALAS